MTEGAGLWAVALRAALDTFEDVGLDVGALCQEIGLDRHSLDDPDLRVPLAVASQIWPLGLRQWGRGGLGLAVGTAMPFGRLEALDYGFATATTVLEGLRCVEGYFYVTTGGQTGIRVHLSDEVVRLEHITPDFPELRDYSVGLTVQRIFRAGVRPTRVLLAGGPTTAAETYESLLGCPVEFDAPASVAELSLEAAHAELPPVFPGLRAIVDREIVRQRELLERADGLADVRRELLSAMGPTTPTLEHIAARLRLSTRTLQRHLSNEGATFSQLLDEARRALAERYLADARASIGEVAYLLGYSEPSAFTRAFKRWTGSAPLEYRRALRGTN